MNPEVDKPGKRKKLDTAGRAGSEDKDGGGTVVDWEMESSPLTATPGKPKFLPGQEDKQNVSEGETIFVTLKVEPGESPPAGDQIEWVKNGAKDMSVFPRCKLWTDGTNNTVTMGLKECKADDEGDFTCNITTTAGTASFDFKLFVTVEGGMDFRSGAWFHWF